jgi:hypothetical protein
VARDLRKLRDHFLSGRRRRSSGAAEGGGVRRREPSTRVDWKGMRRLCAAGLRQSFFFFLRVLAKWACAAA